MQVYPGVSHQSTALEGLKQNSRSALIPEQIPKPLQLFHGIILDDQIKVPSLNGSSAPKQRLGDERRVQKREQLDAGGSQVLSILFPFPHICCLWKRGKDGLFSLTAFCLSTATFPMSQLKLNFSGASS